MKLDRRDALSLIALTGAAPLALSEAQAALAGHVTFEHGVASGDPLQDRVVLWTRVTPAETDPGEIAVHWEVAEDADFRTIAARGKTTTNANRDFTVKVDAAGLKPAQNYFYRFRVGIVFSPVGRTRTLPDGSVKDVVLAFTCCALYPGGFFNAYDDIAKLERVDAVVELGDYYYEYGANPDDYGMSIGAKLGRVPEPPHEIVTLTDYRTRHSLYKRDKDLQAAHARAPWICVWDDHETANDSWAGGAENHDEKTEGPWIGREQAALKAYYEWMPIREPVPGRAFESINRSFQFGDLATLIMVESRLVARSRQLEYDTPGDIPLTVYNSNDPDTRKPVTDPTIVTKVWEAAKAGKELPSPYVLGPDVPKLNAILNDPERLMLGPRQEEWLRLEIEKSVAAKRPWQILGNQVVMGRTVAPNLYRALGKEKVQQILANLPEGPFRKRVVTGIELFSYDIPFDPDGWDGYPAARERVYDAIKASNGNVVVVSGDSHAFWVNDLHDAKGERVAAEFGVSSVTSPSVGDFMPNLNLGQVFMDQNKEVVFCDQNRKGYTLVTITPDQVTGELIAVEHLSKPYKRGVLATYRVTPADGPGVGKIEKVQA
ncbi:MAG TPA: alkaline phosphatase D family protein [Rhizomicrobium sp.]|nr:alkaline phosphatase D family protein [Rhizomicrobium sp.]